MPADLVKKMGADTVAALSNAMVKSKLETIGTVVAPSTPEELGSFIKAQIAKWDAVVREAGISIDG